MSGRTFGGRFRDEWGELRAYVRSRSPRDLVSELDDAVEGNQLFVYASAIAFRIFLAVIPFALAVLAFLGAIGRPDVWQERVAPEIQPRLSPSAFELVDRTARSVLESHRGFWLTVGVVLAVWQVASALRAAMHALNDVYEARQTRGDRSLRRRLLVSNALAVVVIGAFALVALTLQAEAFLADRVGGGAVVTALTGTARWIVAMALMLFVVALLIGTVPERDVPAPWLGAASILVVGLWLGASALFGLYAALAGAGTVFGGVAFLVVAGAYLYVAASAFLVGAQLDALVRSHAGRIE